MPAFRVKLGANDLNCVDVLLNPSHSLTHSLTHPLPFFSISRDPDLTVSLWNELTSYETGQTATYSSEMRLLGEHEYFNILNSECILESIQPGPFGLASLAKNDQTMALVPGIRLSYGLHHWTLQLLTSTLTAGHVD